MKHLKYFVESISKPIIRKNGFVTPQIIFDWPLIVGDYLAETTRPLKIVFPRQKNSEGVLHIEVFSAQSPIIQQLEHEIIEKIAIYFGFKAVHKIKLVHSKEIPEEKLQHKQRSLSADGAKKLDKMLESVKDDELRARLKAIGARILIKNE